MAFLLMSFLLWGAGVFVGGGEAARMFASSETMQEAVKVAVYDGPGVWEPSRTAIVNMYEWVGASLTVVNASDVTSGGLVNYDVFVMPGGNAWDQYEGLGYEEGASRIRDFVNDGGGYIGICAGAYYASDYIVWEGSRYDYTIGLFPGYGDGAIDEIAPWPNYVMTNISIVNRTHPITASLPDYMWILYYGGSEFHPYAEANVTILGRYEVNGGAAIVANEYGSGKVFLTGPHPEIEEDSDRDGTTWGDWLDDQGSDWPLMHAVLEWMTSHDLPTAEFTYSPFYPVVNETVTFNASASYDTDGTIANYTWDFGDQTPPVTETDPITTHAYTAPGAYTLTLTVTDNDTLTDTETADITITAVHDVAVTSITPSPTEVTAGNFVSINVAVKNNGTETETFNVTAYYDTTAIDTKSVTNLVSGAETTLTFTWGTTGITEGNYTIKAVAETVSGETDAADNTKTADDKVTVTAPASPDIPTTLIIAIVIVIIVVVAAAFLYMRRKPLGT